jgi:type IV pilus assembly protein PilB
MSSHPDADAFVSAILRNPAEVTTRLVFADWLEETGDPSNVAWAQFIRLNVEADRHPAGVRKEDAITPA